MYHFKSFLYLFCSLLHLECLCNHECSFSLPVSVHDILKIEIVTDQNTLNEIPDDKYSFSTFGSLTIIHFKDVNFVEENRNFTLRMEYEKVEDCNDVIWVATSDRINTGYLFTQYLQLDYN